MCKLLIVVLFVVVGLGAYLALRPTEAEQYERLRHAQAMHSVAEARAEALAPFEVAVVGGGAVVLVLLLAGAGAYAAWPTCAKAFAVGLPESSRPLPAGACTHWRPSDRSRSQSPASPNHRVRA